MAMAGTNSKSSDYDPRTESGSLRKSWETNAYAVHYLVHGRMHREVNWPKSDKPCLPAGKSSHVEEERRPKMDMEKNRPNPNIFRL
jgi:hypothetical protein